MADETHDTSAPRYQFLTANNFVYRCNTLTGEMWRLQPDPQEKTTQVWVLIADAKVAP